ncbi:unnamed protein product, partial [Prorocentrum cordatum]
PARGPDGEVQLLAEGRDPALPAARVQVKLRGGVRVVFCMEASATIGELEDALARWCADRGLEPPLGERQVLRGAFPPTGYADRSQTLAGAGLTPTATLFVAAEPSGS